MNEYQLVAYLLSPFDFVEDVYFLHKDLFHPEMSDSIVFSTRSGLNYFFSDKPEIINKITNDFNEKSPINLFLAKNYTEEIRDFFIDDQQELKRLLLPFFSSEKFPIEFANEIGFLTVQSIQTDTQKISYSWVDPKNNYVNSLFTAVLRYFYVYVTVDLHSLKKSRNILDDRLRKYIAICSLCNKWIHKDQTKKSYGNSNKNDFCSESCSRTFHNAQLS